MIQELGKQNTGLVLGACCLAMLSVGENSTAIMAALPAMTEGLRLGSATVEWTVNAYLLASAMFIVIGGEAADAFGARHSSAAGVALFALASLVIAFAPTGAVAVAARALQGFGAAFAVPGTLAAVTEAVTDEDRARAIGAWTGFLMLGFKPRSSKWPISMTGSATSTAKVSVMRRGRPTSLQRSSSRLSMLTSRPTAVKSRRLPEPILP